MKPPISAAAFAALLFFGMLALLEVGRRLGVKRRSKESEGERSNLGAIEGALFALFGLLMAFTFSGAATRFNEKRMLIAEEAAAIDTAYLRLQLLPEPVQPKLQKQFRRYLESRLEIYRRLPDMEAARLEVANSKNIQEQIWSEALAGTLNSRPAADRLLLPALNNMFDIATTRTMALQIHPPAIIYALLLGLGLMCSLLAGYRMAGVQRRSWLHIIGFTLVTVIVAYVTLDIEYPRAGLFRFDVADEALRSVLESMK